MVALFLGPSRTIQVAAIAYDQSLTSWKGADMGDKGGKKDKEKNKQQQATKHKEAEQKKQDRAPVRNP